jgi:2-oxoglutarate dehydrogenase E1 component
VTQQSTGQSESFAGFGPNEWLVYEMYQQYLKDPESVDKAWWDFFADYKPTDSGGSTRSNGDSETPRPAPAAAAPQAERTPAKGQSGDKGRPADKAGSGKAAAPAKAEPKAEPAKAKAAKAESKPEPKADAGKSEQDTPAAPAPLRGAAARVVANMEASLAVPTATSVRAIPAKLLIDNRVVINNHLRRGRGGKV